MDQKKTFDIEGFLASKGGTVTGVNPDGSVRFKMDGSEEEKTFDAPSFLKSKGADPSKLNLQYNSPETAFEENALGFSSALKLNFTRTPEDKLKVLQSEFGEENVSQVGEEFRVKENGAWKRAETGFLANLTASSPEMAAGVAGSIAGAKGGAAIGTFVGGPIGTAVGGFLGAVGGGALSAAVAKLGSNEVAEAAGIRTEDDAQTLFKELGKEFVNNAIWDAALLGAGKAVKPLAGLAKGVAGRTWRASMDKAGMAATAEKLLPGTKAADWGTILRSTDDAKSVMKDMDDVIKWETKKAAGRSTSAIDPATDKMNKWVVRSMDTFKRKAFGQYDASMKAIENHGQFAKAQVGVDSTLTSLEKTLTEMGLLQRAATKVDDVALPSLEDVAKPVKEAMPLKDLFATAGKSSKTTAKEKAINKAFQAAGGSKKAVESELEFLPKSQAHNADEIMTLFDAKSRNTLKQVWLTMKNATERDGKLAFSDAKRLLNGIDDILESSGYYKGGDTAISNQARRSLKGIRHEIRNKMSESLRDKFVLIGGKRTSAANIFDDASLKYSQFRQHYDDFAMTSRFGGDASQVTATVNRMFGESGMALEENFGNMARAVGADGTKVLSRLQQLRAAKNLSKAYSPSQTGLSAVLSGVVGYGSPRTVAKNMAERSISMNTKAPPSPKTIAALQMVAKTTNFFNSLAPEARRQVLSSPELYRQMVGTMFEAPELAEQTEQELLSQVPQ